MLDRLHSSYNIVGTTHPHYAWFTKTYGLCPSHDALQVHTTVNTHATTPNIVGVTMLGVVTSVCTEPKSDAINNQTVTSRVDFHLAKRQKLSFRSFNAKISASCQWISVTDSGSYKLDKSVLSIASRIIYYIISVACYNRTK